MASSFGGAAPACPTGASGEVGEVGTHAEDDHNHIAKRERCASLRRIQKPTRIVTIQQIMLNLLYDRYDDILLLRQAALYVLLTGEAGHDLAAPAFIEMLHDENPQIPLKACHTLGLLAEPAAVSTLAKLLLKSAGAGRTQGLEIDLAEEVASAAFHAIVSIPHPRVLSFLKSLEGKGNLLSDRVRLQSHLSARRITISRQHLPSCQVESRQPDSVPHSTAIY